MHTTRIAIFNSNNTKKRDVNLSDKVIGVHRGINFHEDIVLPENLQQAKFHQLPSNEILFDMLIHNRVDAVITSHDVGRYLMSLNSLDNELNVTVVKGYALPVHLAFTKNRIDINKVNEALISINKTSND